MLVKFNTSATGAQADSVAQRIQELGGDNLLDAGLRAAKRGWKIFPCNVKKEPLAQWTQAATTDPATITAWSKWRLVTMWARALPEDVVVIDLDRKHGKDGVREFERLHGCHPDQFAAPQVITATAGVHVYTNPTDRDFKNSVSVIAPGIDTKTDVGYCIIPSGDGVYRWLTDPDTPLPATPAWAEAALRKNVDLGPRAEARAFQGYSPLGNSILESACDAIASAPGGEQELTLGARSLIVGHYVGGGLLEYEPTVKELVKAGLQMVNYDAHDKWTEKLITDKVAKAVDRGMLEPQDGEESFRLMQEVQRQYAEDPQLHLDMIELLTALDAQRNTKGGNSATASAEPQPEPRGQSKQRATIRATPYVHTAPSLLKPRHYLYKPGYVRKYTSMTIANSKVGKSSKSIVEALAMVTGRPLLGILPIAPLRVWYWNGEDPRDEIEKRVAAAMKHYKITEEEIGGRLFIDSGRDMPIKLVEIGKNGTIIGKPTVNGVIEAIADTKTDVFIGDPLISTHRVAENDNNAMQQVIEQWAGIADQTDSSVRVNHHTRKTYGEAVDFESQRGASSTYAAVRYAEVLNYMTEKEAKDAGINPARRKFYFREDFESNLYPPAAENAAWYEKRSVDLENGGEGFESDKIGVVVQWGYPQVDNADISIVQQGAIREALREREAWRESSQATDWVGRPIAEVLGLDLNLKAHRDRVKGVIDKLVAWGDLHPVTMKVHREDKEGYTARKVQEGLEI